MAADRGTNQQGKKVVATSPGVSVWPTPTRQFQPTTAIRDYGTNLDRIENASELYGTNLINQEPFSYGRSTPEQRTAYNMKYYGDENAPTVGSVDIQNPNAGLAAALGMGGGGSGRNLDMIKYQDAQRQAVLDRVKEQARYKALQDYYQTGDWRELYKNLGSQLDTMQTQGTGQIGEIYKSALGNIGAGYADASRMTGQGYNALNQYLAQNNLNPYAGASFTPTTVQDGSQQFMQAYGVDAPEVAQQVATENAYNQQGAQGFNTMYDLLSRAAQQSQQSRMNESQMAQNFANQGLSSTRAAYEAMAAKAQQESLSDLLNRISSSRFDLAQQEGEKGQTLQEQILANTGNDAPLTKQEQITQLAATAPNFKAAVKQFAPAYIEKNPKATVATLKKKFPELAKAFK
jgi:rubrerythrin